MAEKTMGGFDVLIDLAGKFVDSQKGMWDHTAWLNFLSEAQKKTVELSDDMKNNLGLVLESMKKFYNGSTATKGMENVMAGISEHTINFFKKTKGVWDQSEFETYVKDIQKEGFDLTDETRSYLGEVFESLGGFLSPGEKDTKATTKGVEATKSVK